jgi:hypothetical protein
MMSKATLAKMTVDELFASLIHAAIREHEVFAAHEPISQQHKWADHTAEFGEEIKRRGPEAMQGYIPLLNHEHPNVRLIAALVSRAFAQDLAIPVLEELDRGKYGGLIGLNAGMTLRAMARKGLIPARDQ